MTGARIVIEALKKEGVSVVFGYPGGSIIPVFDALYGDKDLQLVLPRHEQAGGHEADGYARASGKTGVVLTTGGPGATNLTTAIATAYMDSVPLVAISGQVKTILIGTDAFQEADMTGITYPIAKHNYLVKDVRDLARTIKEAFHIASTGRPGPVHVSIPIDVQNAEAVFRYPDEIVMRNYNPTYKGNVGQIKKACEYIEKAKKPVILVGGGAVASGAVSEVRSLIAKTGIPTVSTLMALGVVPSSKKHFLGMVGMHGTVAANYAISEADLIMNIGARFDDRVTGDTKTFAKKATVIHIDIDPSSIGKNVAVDLPIVGDAKHVLTDLLSFVSRPKIDQWRMRTEAWKDENPIRYRDFKKAVSPRALFERFNEVTKRLHTIITTEVGQHQMWAAQMLDLSWPRQFLTSGGLGTMGFGFPAAIGAQFTDRDATVVCFAGDGSFQMNMQELALLRTYQLPVKIIILNNGYLGMVRQWQELFHDKRYSATCLSRDVACPAACSGRACRKEYPNFVKLAEAYGIQGYRAETEEELAGIFKETFGEKRCEPALIEVMVPREENVMPMVPSGAALSDVIKRDPKSSFDL